MGGSRGVSGFVFWMQRDRSQNAEDVHMEIHRPKRKRSKKTKRKAKGIKRFGNTTLESLSP